MAEHGRAVRPGVVYVAPAGVNTLLRPGLRIELRTPPPGQFHVPGVDAAFASTATVCGPTPSVSCSPAWAATARPGCARWRTRAG